MPKFQPVTPPVAETSSARSTSDNGWTGRRLVYASAPAGIRPPTGNRRDRRPVSAANSGKRSSSASAARSWSEITRLTVPTLSLRVGRFGVGVLEHLRDNQPRSVGLTLQCAKREVVPVERTAADQPLAFDPQVR